LTLSRIGDVKQHLGRAHRLPVYCGRCKDIFPSEADRDAHAEQQSPCGIRTNIRYEGITADIEKRLKQRVSQTAPEERQWFSIFDILFPDHQPIPQSAYINAELVAETEDYQTFEQVEGPAILLEVLREAGAIERIDNQDHYVGVFRQNILAEGLSLISQRFIERRSLPHGEDAAVHTEADGDTAASVAGGTSSSTTARTLVESQDGESLGVETLLAEKVAEETGAEVVPSNVETDGADVVETASPSTVFPDNIFRDPRAGERGSEPTGMGDLDGMEALPWEDTYVGDWDVQGFPFTHDGNS
jgi:hypothetical protein